MAIVDGKIRCCACKIAKPVAAFAPAIARRGHGACRVCKNARNRSYEDRNREQIKARVREWAGRNREHLQRRGLASYYLHRDDRLAQARVAYQRPEAKAAKHHQHIARRYGISGADYEALLTAQGGACALCRRAPSSTRRLAVDHDHETGRLRGLLCSPCNTALGRLGDTAASIERVLGYIKSAVPVARTTPALRINLLSN